MKKLIHREKLKLKEQAKTVIIVLLFLMCIFLGYRILKLYSIQANVEGLLGGGRGGLSGVTDSGMQSKLATVYDRPRPRMIAVNSYTSRTLLDDDNQMFDDIASLADNLLKEAYSVKSEYISLSDKTEWQNTLNSDSVYIKYPAERFVNTESALCGIKPGSAAERIKSFSEVAIIYKQGNADSVSMIIPEMNSERILRIVLTSDNAKAFKEKARKLDNKGQKEYIFAWELNLDKEDASSGVTLDPMILIPADEEKTADIQVYVPTLYKAGLNYTKATDLTLGLIGAFNYNPNTIRQYTGRNNAIMYVGETGNLNLHPSGLIEYKALDREDGIPLSTKEDFGEAVNSLCLMLERIMRISGINTADTDFEVMLTGMPGNFRFSEKAELHFDYFVDGKKVVLSDSHSISAVIQAGYLVELQMNIKDINVQSKQNDMPALFGKIDEFCNSNPNIGKISNAYGMYRVKNDGENISAEWQIEGVE